MEIPKTTKELVKELPKAIRDEAKKKFDENERQNKIATAYSNYLNAKQEVARCEREIKVRENEIKTRKELMAQHLEVIKLFE